MSAMSRPSPTTAFGQLTDGVQAALGAF